MEGEEKRSNPHQSPQVPSGLCFLIKRSNPGTPMVFFGCLFVEGTFFCFTGIQTEPVAYFETRHAMGPCRPPSPPRRPKRPPPKPADKELEPPCLSKMPSREELYKGGTGIVDKKAYLLQDVTLFCCFPSCSLRANCF